jgi:O-antigen/teichoic acid export membrane protein
MNIDRLYFGKVLSLSLLGVYGIARTLADLFVMLAIRLSNLIIFPLISSSSEIPRNQLRAQMGKLRWRLLFIAGLGLSFLACSADLIVGLLYDERYQQAAWMLPILSIGAWFSMISAINESVLMGFGRPLYGALANFMKLVYLLIGLTIATDQFGAIGALVVISTSELLRYLTIFVSQIKEKFTFGVQDFLLTLVLFLSILIFEWLRWYFNLGTFLDYMSSENQYLL